MNGLTRDEMRTLRQIRAMSLLNLAEAKKMAARWTKANKRRGALRRAACNTVKWLHSA
jgi:hypothetical protein